MLRVCNIIRCRTLLYCCLSKSLVQNLSADGESNKKFCEKFHGMEIKVVLFGLPVFFAVLSGVKSDCNYFQILEPGQTYYAYSPSYPNYTTENHCTWKTESPYNVQVNCTVDMPQSFDCLYDNLSIQFAGSNEQRYCGRGTIALEGKNPIIKYNLPKSTQGGRFLCEIKTEKPSDEYDCLCGWKKPTKIVGGEETGVNEYTMMAGLIDKNERIIYCGATIISQQHVLTAAHCVNGRDVNNLAVVVGEHDVTTGEETNATKLYRLSQYIIHPDFRENEFHNDIAVCKIIGNIKYSAEVGPACLPFQHSCDSFGGSIVTLLGWGLQEFGGAKATTLQEIKTNVISKETCKKEYGVKPNDKIYDNDLCTYSEGKDACQMDSGGPVLWQDPTTQNLALIGIILGGMGCAANISAINTRVGAYVHWIQDVTNVPYCKVE